MLQSTQAILIAVLLVSQSAFANLFEVEKTKTKMGDFVVAESVSVVGRQGLYELKDMAHGEVQVKFFGLWKKVLNGQIVLGNPKPFNCDMDKGMEIVSKSKLAGFRARAAMSAPSHYLTKGLKTSLKKFPKLDTPKKELRKMIAAIEEHGSRSIHSVSLFVERSSSTIWFEFKSKSGGKIKETLIEVNSTESFFSDLIGLWATDGATAKSKMRIKFAGC